MTINIWRNEILQVCKCCKKFIDIGKGRNRYKCGKYKRLIYKARRCGKTFAARQHAAELSKKVVKAACLALVGEHK